MFCREHVVQLHRHHEQLEAAGARLVVIGNGKPHFIAGFRDTTAYDGALYTDPRRAAYRAAGFVHGVRSTFSPRGLRYGVRALRRGHLQGRTQGDPWQQGGTLVIAPNDEVLFSHRSEVAGDNSTAAAVLAAL